LIKYFTTFIIGKLNISVEFTQTSFIYVCLLVEHNIYFNWILLSFQTIMQACKNSE